jgi:hypothetical protein
VKPGFTWGESDDVGYKPAANPVTVYDFHATILHLLGLDHEKLTYYHNGSQRRLTDVHGHQATPELNEIIFHGCAKRGMIGHALDRYALPTRLPDGRLTALRRAGVA